MSYYKERLNSWALVRCLPNMQKVIVERFRNSADAEGRLRILRETMPHIQFAVVFEPPQPVASAQPTA